jgi:hypothetical protein
MGEKASKKNAIIKSSKDKKLNKKGDIIKEHFVYIVLVI